MVICFHLVENLRGNKKLDISIRYREMMSGEW